MSMNSMPANDTDSFVPTTSLHCSRLKDELTINIGDRDMFFTETITVATKIVPENLDSNRNRATFFILPVLRKGTNGNSLLFPVVRPTITVSSGYVEDLVFASQAGVYVEQPSAMGADGLYRFFVVFAREIPREFTIVVSMMVPRDPKDQEEAFLCRMSDDGRGEVFGMPESLLRVLDTSGTHYIVRGENVEMRPNELGWVKVQAEKQYLVCKP